MDNYETYSWYILHRYSIFWNFPLSSQKAAEKEKSEKWPVEKWHIFLSEWQYTPLQPRHNIPPCSQVLFPLWGSAAAMTRPSPRQPNPLWAKNLQEFLQVFIFIALWLLNSSLFSLPGESF